MNENKNEAKELTTEHLAMEVLKQEQEKSRKKNAGLLVGMIILGIATIAVAAFGWIERSHLVDVNYQNDCDWRRIFSGYDFITQDGGGYNNVNSGQQGDVNNGSENYEEKEKESH